MTSQLSDRHVRPRDSGGQPILWESSIAFLKISIAVIVAGVAAFEILLLLFAPEQTERALFAMGPVLVAGVAWLVLSCGRIKTALATLGMGVWAYITLISFYFGGVTGSSIIIYPLTIVLAGWLVGARAAVAVAVVTTLVTLGFVLGETWGILPAYPPTPPAMRWIIQGCVFILSAALISHVVRSYRDRLADVRELGRDLAQRTAKLQVIEADMNRAQAVAHVGSWVYDLADDNMQLSPETCRIFGLPKGTTGSSDSYLACVHPEDGTAVHGAWQAALKGDMPFDNEHRIRVGRRIRWVRQKAELEFDTAGKPQRAVGTTQDITERKRAEMALRRSESQLQGILSATADGILAVDRDGKVIQTNRRFAELWRIPPSLLDSKNDTALLNYVMEQLVDPQAFLEKVQALYASNTEAADIVNFKDGRIFERFTSPLILSGAIVGRVWSFRDITERCRAEAAREQLEVQLRESHKMEALGTLAGGIAHDFNNALAAVIGNLELARQDVGHGHPAQQSLDEIAKASNRAKDLVRQILAFGRRQVLERKRIALSPIVEESIRLLRATQPAGITLRCDFSPDTPLVMADAAQIGQVVINLCTNAWHAVEGQARPGVVEVRLEDYGHATGATHAAASALTLGNLRPGRYACLSVRDNGMGMDEATQRRIFEPFFTTKAVGKGTGLGLAVVHGIAQGHEGIIEIHSKPGEGTTFRFYLPAVEAVSPEIREPGGLAVHGHGGDAPRPQGGGGKQILYVDDDEALVFLMTRLLERQGYRVCGYTEPEKALAAVRADPMRFDLVVTDYSMPGISGLAVVQELKKIRVDLPVAMASGYLTDDLRAKALAAGVCELIYKPNTVEELCEAVARLVSVR
ncbi:MAG: response regulator [Burkholderiales bacterium]